MVSIIILAYVAVGMGIFLYAAVEGWWQGRPILYSISGAIIGLWWLPAIIVYCIWGIVEIIIMEIKYATNKR